MSECALTRELSSSSTSFYGPCIYSRDEGGRLLLLLASTATATAAAV